MKTFILLSATLFTTPVFAQHTAGTIRYEEKISLDLNGDDIPENLKAFVPKEQKSQKVLYFNADHSLYENTKLAKEDGAEEYEQGGVKIRMEHSKPDEKVFVTFTDKKSVEQRDLMGRLFLVKGTMDPKKWKFTGRQKKILDMPCQEALMSGEGDTVTAWYTTMIPVPGGPKNITGLPGMILEAALGSNITIKAIATDFTEDVSKKIKEPVKGKAITNAAYEKLQAEKIEEMEKQYGGKGKVIIRSTTSHN